MIDTSGLPQGWNELTLVGVQADGSRSEIMTRDIRVDHGIDAFGTIDTPTAATETWRDGVMEVAGWMVGDQAPVRFDVVVDGRAVASTATFSDRADVRAAFPEYDSAYGYTVEVPDLYLNTGVNDLQVVATLADGSRVAMDNWDMGVREVTVTASGRYVGAHLDPANDYASRIQAWTDQTGGLGPDMTMYFESWEGYQTFGAYPYLPEQIAGAGSLTMVTWESFGSTLEDIYTGQQDAYITEWARRVADYGETVIVRFDHEFNNHEYPWTGQQNGNNPAAYVAAFRHVATLVEQAGADNARFMWSPNYRASGETEAPSDDMENYYPGRRLRRFHRASAVTTGATIR